MKLNIYSIKGEAKGSVSVKTNYPVRTDLVQRAVASELSLKRQPYGTDPLAGKRTSAHYHGRRGIRHSMMNREMARMKRIHGSGFLHMTARFVPQAIKGRKAHPPKVEKDWEKGMNKKEWRKALASAFCACLQKELVEKRGHKIKGLKQVPVIIENKFASVKKAKEVLALLEKLGLKQEIERAKEKKVRAGKGTARGRRYKRKKSLLIVVKEDKGISKAAENIPGVDVVEVGNLSVSDLVPGTKPGRLSLWTEAAFEHMKKFLKENGVEV